MTTSPEARSIALTLPQVNVTSPYFGKSMFASYTLCFKSSSMSNLFPCFILHNALFLRKRYIRIHV